MTIAELPSVDELRSLFRYDPETGDIFWAARDKSMTICGRPVNTTRLNAWNSRLAGKETHRTLRHGYRTICLDSKGYQAHRLVYALYHGYWPDKDIDHINGNRADNRIENLRDVSRSTNSKNGRRRRNNTSGIMGVDWRPSAQKWRARICDGGVGVHLGYFDNLADAVDARKRAAAERGFSETHGRD